MDGISGVQTGPGGHAVHPDAPVLQGLGQGVGEGQDRALGGGVVDQGLGAAQPVDGRGLMMARSATVLNLAFVLAAWLCAFGLPKTLAAERAEENT